MGWARVMLTIICTYFNSTIVKIAYFAKTRHVDEMDWVLLRTPWAAAYAYNVGRGRVRTNDKASALRGKECLYED